MITLASVFWMLWSAPAVLLSLCVQAVLRFAGWVQYWRQERIEFGHQVDEYFASGWLARHWPGWLGGCAWLPACVILHPAYRTGESPPVEMRWEPGHLARTLSHEFEHANQWRQWSLLFPFAYGVAALLALPHPYRNNYFERRARRVAGQGE